MPDGAVELTETLQCFGQIKVGLRILGLQPKRCFVTSERPLELSQK